MSQEKLILDMALGDGYIAPPRTKNGNCSLRLKHSTKQTDYLLFKKSLLEEYGFKCSLNSYIDPKGFGVIYLITSRKELITNTYFKLYIDNKKKITEENLYNFDARSLAILFQDDGSRELVKFHRAAKVKYEINPYINAFVLHLQCFSVEEINLLRDKLLDMGIESRNGQRKGNVILISKKESKKRFVQLISPFMCPSMAYKINYPVSYHGRP